MKLLILTAITMLAACTTTSHSLILCGEITGRADSYTCKTIIEPADNTVCEVKNADDKTMVTCTFPPMDSRR